MEEIDKTSLIVTCAVDETVAGLERRLNREGFTLGYRPAAAKRLTLRKALERRVPNRDALLYGGIEDLCISLQAMRKGESLVTRNVPRAATGPDFKKILIGSGSSYAKIHKASFRIHPRPEIRDKIRLVWTEARHRDEFLRKLGSSGIRPVSLATRRKGVVVILEGSRALVHAERSCLNRLARETRGRMI